MLPVRPVKGVSIVQARKTEKFCKFSKSEAQTAEERNMFIELKSCCSTSWKTYLSPPPPCPLYNGYIGMTLSICSSVHVSNHIPVISLELLNHFLPNMVLWCIVMRWCVMQKNVFIIFNVKVTARAYIIKMWQFLLYLLKRWSICNQI